jgi:hypothetical protein
VATPDAPAAPALVESVRNFEAAYRSKVTLWRQRLDRIRNDELRAVVWGAGSKGVTFLNALEVPHDVLPYVVDLNPRKHGRFVVGTGQQIVPPSTLRQYRPQWVVVMNAIYAAEIGQTLRELNVEAEALAAG